MRKIPDEMMDEIGGSGHKMGGYPMFTQWDPGGKNGKL